MSFYNCRFCCVIAVSQKLFSCTFSLRYVIPLSSTLLDDRRRNGQRHLTTQVLSYCKTSTQAYCVWLLLQGKRRRKYLFVCACICVCVCRGVMEGRRGWSVLLKEPAQWVELEGSDYVLDLMSDLELPADFPKHSSYFIISAQEPTRVRPNASM